MKKIVVEIKKKHQEMLLKTKVSHKSVKIFLNSRMSMFKIIKIKIIPCRNTQ
jgi:hypothetical protein